MCREVLAQRHHGLTEVGDVVLAGDNEKMGWVLFPMAVA